MEIPDNARCDIWPGVAYNGRIYRQKWLCGFCRDFGEAMVSSVCRDFDLPPSDENRAEIYRECMRREDALC